MFVAPLPPRLNPATWVLRELEAESRRIISLIEMGRSAVRLGTTGTSGSVCEVPTSTQLKKNFNTQLRRAGSSVRIRSSLSFHGTRPKGTKPVHIRQKSSNRAESHSSTSGSSASDVAQGIPTTEASTTREVSQIRELTSPVSQASLLFE